MHVPAVIQDLVGLLKRFPGVGEKTARRLAFFVIDQPESYRTSFARVMERVGTEVCRCDVCHGISEGAVCSICADTRRDLETLCVVETVQDQMALEASGHFRGRYHVLHGVISPLRGINPGDLTIDALVARLQHDEATREVIIATNVDIEGEATALYLKKRLRGLSVTITRIASGVPTGGDIEFLDSTTISRAMERRYEL